MNIANKTLNFVLIAIIIGFSFLRLYRLSSVPVSLFSDEVDIGYQVKSLLSTGKDYQGNPIPLQFHSFSDVRTPIPIYSTALISLLPGVSVDLAIRLTPAIFSLLGIIGIYLLTNSLFRIYKLTNINDLLPGIIAASLLSLAPWHFTYSRTGFELSQLFALFSLGLYFLVGYLETKRIGRLIISLIFLSLLPAVYSTAKLSILLFPFLFLTLPNFFETLKSKKTMKFYSLLLFLPLLILIINGGAGKRFSEIAVYTDPTLATQTNFLRQEDLGQNLVIGSSPSLISKIAHNKPLMITSSIVKNLFGPISTDFLFSAGDMNLRHAVPGWGMLLKSFALVIALGLFLLISGRHHRFVLLILVLSTLAIVPSALTRDGATHSSRTFLLILPLILSATAGLYLPKGRKILLPLVYGLLLFESFLYLHDYFIHYPYVSQRDFHSGLKELVSEANKYPGRKIVLTRTYEPSLIFFLYYTDYPAILAQGLIPEGRLTEGIGEELNLEGVKIAGTDIYLANVRDFGKKDPLVLKDAIYVLPAREAGGLVAGKYATKISDINLPSGEHIFSTIMPATPSAAPKQSI